MAFHRIKSVFKEGMEFVTDLKGHRVNIDLSPKSGGNSRGPEPKPLMLVALAGCTGVDVVMILHKMRVKFSEFSIDVDAQLTETEPAIYHTVKLTYNIKVDKNNESKVGKAVDLSQNKYCSVSAMFKSFAKIDTEIIYN